MDGESNGSLGAVCVVRRKRTGEKGDLKANPRIRGF